MGVITFEQSYVSRADINNAIEAFNLMVEKGGPALLEFDSDKKIEDIDILFAGYLLLFKCQLPDLNIFLRFKNGISPGAEYKLKQYGSYSYLLSGKGVFTAELPEGTVNFDRSKADVFEKGEFVLSDRFMLLLPILRDDRSLFDMLLETSLAKLAGYPLRSGVEGVGWNGDNQKLFGVYTDALVAKARPAEREKCIIDLGRLAFFNCLHEAKILAYYVDQGHLKIPGRAALKAYYGRIESIFDTLGQRPLIYSFVFASLMASDLIPSKLSLQDTDLRHAARKIWDLWQFTENLVGSLYELAKNIRDHTSSGYGVITARVTTQAESSANTVDGGTLLNRVIVSADAEKRPEPDAFLDIHVIDLGKDGIIPTFLKASQRLLERFAQNPGLRDLIQQDIDQFRDRSFRLDYLFAAESVARLNQQSKRAIAHIGLLTLSKLIAKNKGILKVDTQDHNHKRQAAIVGQKDVAGSEVQHGTFFTIILPLRKDITYRSHLPGNLEIPAEPSPNELKGIEKLFEFNCIDIACQEKIQNYSGKVMLTYACQQRVVRSRDDEYNLWLEVESRLHEYADLMESRHDQLVHLDFEKVSIGSSSILRLAGYWEVYYPKLTLLISNIPNQSYTELAQINLSLTEKNPDIGFWNEYSPLIFYSYGSDQEGNRFYFTDVFLGKKSEDFFLLNRLVHRNHFNSTTLLNTWLADKSSAGGEKMNHLTSGAFFNKGVLLPFDLLLNGQNNATMFETNAAMLLRNEIDVQRELSVAADIMALVKNFSGYRIVGSHYRIGSKLHISDFYYANRMFQNSFFASRFAFILAREILHSLDTLTPGEQELVRQKGATLIGYGLYSELLISLVEKFLQSRAGFVKGMLNHDLVSDETASDRIRSVELKCYLIIIVPIASTFSTAIKIEEGLRAKDKDGITGGKNPLEQRKVLSPHYNILHIAEHSATTSLSAMEEEFGWTSKDLIKKEIRLKAFFDEGEQKVQKYLIALPTKWEKIESCRSCFPVDEAGREDLLKEKPLFETGNNSVTPAIVFGYPRGRVLEDSDAKRDFVLTVGMIKYGHYAPTNSHFIFSIDTEEFLKVNLDAIKKWMKEVKECPEFVKIFAEYEHTILISSCHYANVSFIDLINEELFHSSANIIHYDPENDHIQNFRLIYGDEISRADKIIFVDDTLKSGETFDRIYTFVSQIRTKPDEGINACILLIDKSEQFTHDTICNRLAAGGRMYGFANLHLYTSLTRSRTSTMQLEKERYVKLAGDSFLDSLKVYFVSQERKLADTGNGKPPAMKGGMSLVARKQRHLLMIEATHLIYQYFSDKDRRLSGQMSFNDFIRILLAEIRDPLSNGVGSRGILDLFPLNVAILKALTQYPFTQYEPLRKYVFKWVLELLDSYVEKITLEIDGKTFDIISFRSLRFLIRRATLMNFNYLISDKMFGFFQKLYERGAIPQLRDRPERVQDAPASGNGILDELEKVEEAKNDLYHLRTFPIFICAQVKELLSKNPIRSIKIEKLLKQRQGMRAGFDPDWRQLIRILTAENAMIIQKFYEWLEQDGQWKKLYLDEKNHSLRSRDNALIKEFLLSGTVTGHQVTRSLEDFLDVTGQEKPAKNEAFQNYLWIRNYLSIDPTIDKGTLTERTAGIFAKLRLIFESPKNAYLGIFLAIPNGERGAYIVYDQNDRQLPEMDSNNWPGAENIYLQEFLNGIQPDPGNYLTTILELRKSEPNKVWLDQYFTQTDNTIRGLSYDFLSKQINGLILMRLSRRIAPDLDKRLGVLGIYFFVPEGTMLTDANSVRYLLLLKDSLSAYVERHYLSNEFRDWLYAENTKRLAILSGHGKEMLKRLITKPNGVYNEIASTLEQLQAIILFQSTIRTDTSLDDIRETFNKVYDVKGKKMINDAYFRELKVMAKEVYDFEEIETYVECDLDFDDVQSDISFAFNRKILNLICFELFVNAKKNRWHFLKEDELTGDSYGQNILTVKVRPVQGEGSVHQLELKVMNLSPIIDEDTLFRLNSRATNVKPNDITAGSSLLKSVIRNILGGEIQFEVKPAGKYGLQEFTVTVILKEMN